MQRRQIIQTAVGVASAAFFTPMLMAKQKPQVEVWKDADCGCCKDWIKHLETAGFQVKAHDGGNADARTRLRMPEKLGSCHTALVGGYAIEGHVPAKEIRRLLKERPKAIGLTVPGMPVGSPGMDAPIYRGRKDAYEVLLVLEDGNTRNYQSYSSQSSVKS